MAFSAAGVAVMTNATFASKLHSHELEQPTTKSLQPAETKLAPHATDDTFAESLKLTSNSSGSNDKAPHMHAAPPPADEGTTTAVIDADDYTPQVIDALKQLLLGKGAVNDHSVTQTVNMAGGSGAPLIDNLLSGPMNVRTVTSTIQMYAAEAKDSEYDDHTPTAGGPSGIAKVAAPAPEGEDAAVEEVQADNAEDADNAVAKSNAVELYSARPQDKPAWGDVAAPALDEGKDAKAAGAADNTPTLPKKQRQLNKRIARRAKKTQNSRTVAVFAADELYEDTPAADSASDAAEEVAPAPVAEEAPAAEALEGSGLAEDNASVGHTEASEPRAEGAPAGTSTAEETLQESGSAPAPQLHLCKDTDASGACKDESACSGAATHAHAEADEAWAAGPVEDTRTLSKKERQLAKRMARRAKKTQSSRTVAIFAADELFKDTPAADIPSGTDEEAAPAPGGEGAPVEEEQADTAEEAASGEKTDIAESNHNPEETTSAEEVNNADLAAVSGSSEEEIAIVAENTAAETPEESGSAAATQHAPQHDVRADSNASSDCQDELACSDAVIQAHTEAADARAAGPVDDTPAQPKISKKQHKFNKRMERRAKKAQCSRTVAVFGR